MTKKYITLIVLATFFIHLSITLKAQDTIIGNQIWSTTNLEVKTFRNGDVIPEAKTTEEWLKATQAKQPAWCYYKKKKKNGVLYNWYAVNDPRQLAPEGYHVPSDEEWSILIDYLGGDNVAGETLKSKKYWHYNIGGSEHVRIAGNGNDSAGFNAIAGGLRSQHGYFLGFGKEGYWWSSSENNSDFGWVRSLLASTDEIRKIVASKGDGYSVRCVKD